MLAANAAGSGCVSGTRSVLNMAVLRGILGSPVERLDRRALPCEKHKPRDRDDEGEEEESRPREPQVAGIGRVSRERPDVDAPERGKRGKERVLRGGVAMVAKRHEERDEGDGPHAAREVLQ